MKIKILIAATCLTASLTAVPAMSSAAARQECIASKPNAASYTWNFKKEAAGLLQEIQFKGCPRAKPRRHFAGLWSYERAQLGVARRSVEPTDGRTVYVLRATPRAGYIPPNRDT